MNKFVSEDGTPMIDFQCYDCDWHDHGHVHGDADDWTELKVVRNGKVVIHDKPKQ